MDLVELQKKLIAAARQDRPADQVPYAFKKRITALLAARAAENMHSWVRGLWRAAVSCVAITLLFGAWALLNPAATAAPDESSQNLESTLLASVDQNDQAQ